MRFPAHRSGSPALSAVAVAGTVLASVIAASCGDAPTRSSERFCGELTAHQTEIHTPPETPDDIPSFIVLFSKMGEVAPLDVQADWESIYTALKTANTVDVNDPESLQAVTDSAIAQQQSYVAVAEWARTTCGLDLGPIGIVAGGADIATTTTSPTTSAGTGPETTVSGG